MHRERAVRLFPVELLVIGAAAFTWLLYSIAGVPLRDPFRLYLEKLQGGFVWYASGFPLCLLVLRLLDIHRGRSSLAGIVRWKTSWNKFRENYLTIKLIVRDFRLVNALALSFVIFINLKHLVFFFCPQMYDQWFVLVERKLCGGVLCSELVVKLLGPGSAEFMNQGYLFFFPYLGLLLMSMVLQRNSVLSQEFCFAFVLVWFLGITLVFILPTLGPCYFVPDVFSVLPETEVSLLSKELWRMKEFVEAFPKSPKGAYLISGFPSLHLAAPVLGTLYLRRVSTFLALLSFIFCVLTVATTLYFGWHYLYDDIGAVLLACFVYIGVHHFFREESNAV